MPDKKAAQFAMIDFLIVLFGSATIYDEPRWYGQPLYCDGWATEYAYTREMAEHTPWVAIDVKWYRSGLIKCGDVLIIELGTGDTFTVRALDAGPFSGHRTVHGPAIVDMPGVVLDALGIGYFGVTEARVTRLGKVGLRP